VQVEVDLREEDEEIFLNVNVHDTGVGIKSENICKLFKLFGFIEDTETLNPKGIGLGLAIADHIVTQYGGKMGVQSEYGQGSTFSFTIKL